jgi:hypothetical protein
MHPHRGRRGWPWQFLEPELSALPAQATAVLMPGAEHDAARRGPVELELMHSRPVGMTVDQQVHVAGTHSGLHCRQIDIHDLPCAHARMTPAASARLLCEAAAHLQRQAQELSLPARLAYYRAQQLVRPIRRAQRITVREQRALAVQINHHRVNQQSGAAALLEAPLQQKVAIAVHDVTRHAARAQRAQRVADLLPMWILIIVSDPGLEQIPKDVERIGAGGPSLEEIDELCADGGFQRIQMQIGDEQRAHSYRSYLRI